MARRAGGGTFSAFEASADYTATPLSVAFGDTSPTGRGSLSCARTASSPARSGTPPPGSAP
ncbi:hypothetical protein CFHF_15730 [Caulobacter flavus]|uniref:Uncharacterized protein n=1 Tax=Caulobacter flavus TaxID=1679497 RepID=A0A2N5CRM9_9CAUL|nr:hypothetical protein C1707_08810 [Caulobacter flavus]PLR12019.1 hypothetical protein CFHF_15730 [Caulobacter flavus]